MVYYLQEFLEGGAFQSFSVRFFSPLLHCNVKKIPPEVCFYLVQLFCTIKKKSHQQDRLHIPHKIFCSTTLFLKSPEFLWQFTYVTDIQLLLLAQQTFFHKQQLHTGFYYQVKITVMHFCALCCLYKSALYKSGFGLFFFSLTLCNLSSALSFHMSVTIHIIFLQVLSNISLRWKKLNVTKLYP